MIGLLAFPAITAAGIFAAAWLWAGAYDGRPTPRLLAALTATSAAIVVLEVALALVGLLAPVPLAVVSWIVVAAAVAAWIARRPARAAAIGRIARPTAIGAVLGAVTAAAYGAAIGIAALVPPYGWDSLVYHLTDVFQFAQKGTLAVFPFPGRNLYYPQVGELHSLWAHLLSGASAESWRTAGVALLPLALTAGVAARAAAEALGLRAALPWIVPAVMLAPIMITQPLSAYVDVAFAAFVLAAFAFALLAAAEGRFAHLALCALAAGLGLGVKISFVYFGVPAVVVLASSKAWSGFLRGGRQTVARRAVLCLALFLSGCGYWLGRNWIQTGNPIYPSRVQIAGVTVLEGPKEISHSKRQQGWFVPSTAAWLRYPFLETFEGKAKYSLENGFGPLFAGGFVATFLAAWIAIRRRRWILLRALFAAPITVALYLTVNPYQEPRYVIAIVGFALVAVAAVAEEVSGGAPGRLLAAALTVGTLVSAAGALSFASPDLSRVLAEWRAGAWSPERFYSMHYGAAGETFNWIAARSGAGKTVTFTQSAFLAPLFGWHGRNRVVYASTSGDERIGKVVKTPSYRAWRRFLHDHRVDWVVVWVPWWEGEAPRKSDLWIGQNPGDFALVKDFAGRAKVYEPVFRPEEAETLIETPLTPGLHDLDSPDAWILEYREGATARISAADGGGIRIDYSLDTGRNDYLDLRAEVEGDAWSATKVLSFDVETLEPAPALLFVWLKDEDPRKACRFRVDLRALPPGRQQVRLDLSAPERVTRGFRADDVRELHLVVDDADDGATMKGSVRVSGFRLDTRDEGTR
jgi:hypothetical protein